jgi:hypothetical protein
MRRATTVFAIAVTLGWTAPLSAQAPVMRTYGTVQVQFNTTTVDEAEAGGVAPSTFETRRIRLGTEVRFGDALLALVEPDLAMGRLTIRQAWIQYTLADDWALRAGQFKKPFGLIQLTTHTQVPTIERGARIRGLVQALALADESSPEPLLARFRGALLVGDEQALLDLLGYHGYDLGAAVIGRVGAFGVEAGLFNGNGPDQLDDTGAKSFAARATYALAGSLVAGAAASYRETRLGGAASPRTSGWAGSADLRAGEFRRPGAMLLAEVAVGDNFVAGTRFLAAQAIVSWFAPVTFGRFEAVEPVGRVGYADPSRVTGGDDALLLTPGVNLYLTGRNRLMLNWDVFVPGGERFTTQHALRAQAQFYY